MVLRPPRILPCLLAALTLACGAPRRGVGDDASVAIGILGLPDAPLAGDDAIDPFAAFQRTVTPPPPSAVVSPEMAARHIVASELPSIVVSLSLTAEDAATAEEAVVAATEDAPPPPPSPEELQAAAQRREAERAAKAAQDEAVGRAAREAAVAVERREAAARAEVERREAAARAEAERREAAAAAATQREAEATASRTAADAEAARRAAAREAANRQAAAREAAAREAAAREAGAREAAAREAAARETAAREAAVRLAAREAAARIASEREASRREAAGRRAAEEAARMDAARRAAVDLANQENERRTAVEAARSEAARREIARQQAVREDAARLAAAEAARQETARRAAAEAARQDATRRAAELAARRATETAAQREAARLAAEGAAQREAARLAAAEAARAEAVRVAAAEAARMEAARVATARRAMEQAAREEAARRVAAVAAEQEAARRAVTLATQQEAARRAAERAAQQNTARLAAAAAARQEAARLAAAAAARAEAARRVVAAQEAARAEAARRVVAAREAARVEAARRAVAAREAVRAETALREQQRALALAARTPPPAVVAPAPAAPAAPRRALAGQWRRLPRVTLTAPHVRGRWDDPPDFDGDGMPDPILAVDYHAGGVTCRVVASSSPCAPLEPAPAAEGRPLVLAFIGMFSGDEAPPTAAVDAAVAPVGRLLGTRRFDGRSARVVGAEFSEFGPALVVRTLLEATEGTTVDAIDVVDVFTGVGLDRRAGALIHHCVRRPNHPPVRHGTLSVAIPSLAPLVWRAATSHPYSGCAVGVEALDPQLGAPLLGEVQVSAFTTERAPANRAVAIAVTGGHARVVPHGDRDPTTWGDPLALGPVRVFEMTRGCQWDTVRYERDGRRCRVNIPRHDDPLPGCETRASPLDPEPPRPLWLHPHLGMILDGGVPTEPLHLVFARGGALWDATFPLTCQGEHRAHASAWSGEAPAGVAVSPRGDSVLFGTGDDLWLFTRGRRAPYLLNPPGGALPRLDVRAVAFIDDTHVAAVLSGQFVSFEVAVPAAGAAVLDALTLDAVEVSRVLRAHR